MTSPKMKTGSLLCSAESKTSREVWIVGGIFYESDKDVIVSVADLAC